MKNNTILAIIVIGAIVMTALYVNNLNNEGATTESNIMPVNGIMALNDTYYLSDPIKVSGTGQSASAPCIYKDKIYYFKSSNSLYIYDIEDGTSEKFESGTYSGNYFSPSVHDTYYVRPMIPIIGGTANPYYFCMGNETWKNINPLTDLRYHHILNPTIATNGGYIAYINDLSEVYLYNSSTEITTQLPMPYIEGGNTYEVCDSIVMDNTRVVFEAKNTTLGSGLVVVYDITDGTNYSLPIYLGNSGSLRCLEDDNLAFHRITTIGGQTSFYMRVYDLNTENYIYEENAPLNQTTPCGMDGNMVVAINTVKSTLLSSAVLYDIADGTSQVICENSTWFNSGKQCVYKYANGSYGLTYVSSDDNQAYMRWLLTEEQAIAEEKIIVTETAEETDIGDVASNQETNWKIIGAITVCAIVCGVSIYYLWFRDRKIYGKVK